MSAVAEAERRIRSGHGTSELSLAGLGLNSVAPLLPALQASRTLQSLDLSDNHLTELPVELGSAASALVRLNLAGNPVPGVQTVLPALRALPALRELWVDLPVESEEDQLIVSLPNLERFNGTSLIDDDDAAPLAVGEAGRSRASAGDHNDSAAHATYWTSKHTREVESLFTQVTEASAGATHPQEFFDYLSRVVKHVTCLTAADDDPLCQEGEVLKARQLLFEYCFEEMAKAVARKDPTMGKGIAALAQYNAQLLEAYDTHWRRIFRDRDARLTLMKKDMKDAIKQIESLMIQVGGGDAEVTTDRGEEGRGDAAAATPDADRPRGGSSPAALQNADSGAMRSDDDGDAVHTTDSGRARRAADASAATRPTGSSPGQSRTPADRRRGGTGSGLLDSGYAGAYSHGITTKAGSHRDDSGTQRPDSTRGSRARAHGADGSYNGKVLTLKQLKDAIDDIYSSKTKYDAKCRENGLPRETMEQHMYTYLNQRYGLKEIIQDWAAAIARGVQRYAAEDNDVAVFGKILRNDIDEEFRYVQRQVRDTVRELVRAQIRARHPLKGAQEVTRRLEKKMAGTLAEEEWGDVVRYMYNKQDAATLVALVRKTIYQQTMSSRLRRSGHAGTPPAAQETQIPYKDLVHLLLDFQLEGHERFLARYIALFRRYDRDGNGIVNREEFKAIVRAIDDSKGEDEVEAMASLVDPFGSQLITLSETVSFLSDELVKMAKEQP